jgi:putative Mn2+ efflux pump MntP
VFVSRTLSRNGLPFLVRGFKGDEDLARSTNHLLVVGFYLLNLGFVLLQMRTGVDVNTVEQLIIYQAQSIGQVLVILGMAHFFNMAVIHQLGRGQPQPSRHVAGQGEPPRMQQ